MIATQKNLDTGYVMIHKKDVGPNFNYDEYARLPNVTIKFEGTPNEHLVFITISEDAMNLLPSEAKAAEMAKIINEEVVPSAIPSVLNEEGESPAVENDPLYENIQSLENEYLTAIEEEASMNGGRMIDYLKDIENKERPGDIFLSRFKDSGYVVEMAIEHNDALCDLLDLEVIPQTDSYDVFMTGMISFAKNTIGTIELLERVDDIENLSAHISTGVTSELIDEIAKIKGFEPENKRAFELLTYQSYASELNEALKIAEERHNSNAKLIIVPMSEENTEDIKEPVSPKAQ